MIREHEGREAQGGLQRVLGQDHHDQDEGKGGRKDQNKTAGAPAAKKRNSSGSLLQDAASEEEDYLSTDEDSPMTGMMILHFRVEDRLVSEMLVWDLKEMKCEMKRERLRGRPWREFANSTCKRWARAARRTR